MKSPSSNAKIFKPVGEWNIRSLKDLESVTKALGAKVYTKNGIIFLDLQGGILDGTKQKGDGGQSENQTPLLRARIPLVVQNGFIRNNKNALTFYAPDSGVKNLNWINIGEDAVATSEGAFNFFVEKCEFSGAKDKSIQLNEAKGAKVYNNKIYGGTTGVRLGEISFTERDNIVYCGGNEFFNVDTAWHVAKLTVIETESNKYSSVRLKYKLVEGAKVNKK
jgi:hypothetical protein